MMPVSECGRQHQMLQQLLFHARPCGSRLFGVPAENGTTGHQRFRDFHKAPKVVSTSSVLVLASINPKNHFNAH